MGRILLVGRLAARNLRRRPAEAALLLLAITGTTAVLTLGLVLRGVTDDPYERTREATTGPDVVASVRGDAFFDQPADLASLEELTSAPGVIDHSGPYPVVGVELEAPGVTQRHLDGEDVGGAGAWAQGRDPSPAAVDQPEVTKATGSATAAWWSKLASPTRSVSPKGTRSPCGPVCAEPGSRANRHHAAS